jgi:periplasmic protein TonB
VLVRLIAVLASLAFHGVVAYAIWPRLEQEKLDILDLGKGADIVLTPAGQVTSAVTNLGENIASLDTPQVVPVQQHEQTPEPQSVNPTTEVREVAAGASKSGTPDAVALNAEQPATERPADAATEQLSGVVGSEESPVEQNVAVKPEPASNPLEDTKSLAVSERKQPTPAEPAAPPAQIDSKEPVVAKADAPAQSALQSPKISETQSPSAPEQLKEPTSAELRTSRPTHSLEQQKPESKEVQAQPEEVAVVMEESSGEEKSGGAAETLGIYLGKVNEQVQRAKVNPHTLETGRVVLKFTIATNGSLLSKEVLLSSKSVALDAAALTALIRAAPFPPIPPEVSAKPMSFTQVFKFLVR